MIERTALASLAQRPGKDSILFVMAATVPSPGPADNDGNHAPLTLIRCYGQLRPAAGSCPPHDLLATRAQVSADLGGWHSPYLARQARPELVVLAVMTLAWIDLALAGLPDWRT